MKLLIVGGVAGGASAAARARRLNEKAEIILFERGEHISFANCGLPYHIGNTIKDRERLLVTTPEVMKKKFAIDVRVKNEVIKINRDKKEVVVKNLLTDEEYVESYDALILSTGSSPFKPPIPGIETEGIFTLRNLNDMDAIKKSIKGKKRSVIVGGGYVGLEMAEALKHRGMEVVLVELAEQVMGPADPEMASLLHTELQMSGVNLQLGKSVTKFEKIDNGILVILSSGEKIKTDAVIVAIGVRPETNLAADADIEIGVTHGIKVNSKMQTSEPNIYAVGDVVEVTDFNTGKPALIPLAGPANRQGRIAADNIFGKNSEYKSTQGSAACKVFDLTFGMTGLSEKAAKKNKIKYDKVYVHPASHASYYPGAFPITLKLLFDPEKGTVLGAQAVGADGVDKRIDVLAIAIRSKMTVFDLEEFELVYAPPYGSAKDPINYAGFVASNIIKGDSEHCHVDQISNLTKKQKLLDVRGNQEIVAGMIPGSMHIPLEDLRERIGELSADIEYIVYCSVGLRGYIAYRILKQDGLKVKNLDGGYKTYNMFMNEAEYKKIEMEDDAGGGFGADAEPEVAKEAKVLINLDVCGLQCPGPIGKLREAIDTLKTGEAVEIVATDQGFVGDVPAWCRSTGNECAELEKMEGGKYRAIVVKRDNYECITKTKCDKKMTNVIFSNDFDKIMAALIIANGAAASGYKVTLFFTFWALSLLRKDKVPPTKKGLVDKMFGMMLPKGPNGMKLSKMNMGGMGTVMMNYVMKEKNINRIDELLQQAIDNGVNLSACSMSMDVMGIKKEELIDGVKVVGVAAYIEELNDSSASLFI